MGGVCSKSDTKKRKASKDAATGGETGKAAAAQPAQSSPHHARRDSDPHYPVVDLADVEAEEPAAAAVLGAGSAPAVDTGSNFTLSTTHGGVADASLAPFSPTKLDSTKQPVHTGTSAACPPPAKKGESFNQWFPADHDAGMQLGDGKYTGVGVQTPLSEAPSAELHSLASTPNYRIPSPVTSSPGLPLPPPLASSAQRQQQQPPRPYDPMRFVDEDSAAPETDSSAFATPRELRDGLISVADFADNTSLVSHGSMMSQHPHGYRYYNSSNTVNDSYYASTSSRRQSIGSASMASAAVANAAARGPQPSVRSTAKSAMTVTNVRNNQQVPAVPSAGRPSPFSRQTSRAASDRFQSCRSIGDASTSAASYLPPTSPAGGNVTEADVLLLSAQAGSNFSGNRRGSLGSLRSGGYPPSSPGGVPAVFYSCRSLGTGSEQSAMSPLTAQSQVIGPASSSHFVGTGVPRGMALPPRSPRGSPMTLLTGTPNAQQLFLHHQASPQSAFGDAPASEAFFSVCGSSRDVFLDLPSAAEASTVYTLDDDRDLELTLGSRGHAQPALVPASPASHYSSSVGAAAALAAAPVVAGTASAGPLGSPSSGSASSAWLGGPVAASTTRVPEQRQRRPTAPSLDAIPAGSAVDGGGGGVAAGGASQVRPTAVPEASASDYDTDRSSVATSWPEVASGLKAATRRKPVPSKPYYTTADFPANDLTTISSSSPPPLAVQTAQPGSRPLAPPKRTQAAAAAAPLPVMMEAATMDATYVTLSTPSETSTRKSGAARPTLRYPEEVEVDGDESGDAVRPRALAQVVEVQTTVLTASAEPPQQQQQAPRYTMPTASSTNSFSTVASSYRREQQPTVTNASASSPDASQGDPDRSRKASATTTTTTAGSPQPRRRPVAKAGAPTSSAVKPRASLRQQRAKGLADPTAAAAAPAAPLMTNPNPWVPGGTTAVTESAHVDPCVVDESGQVHPREHADGATPASATTPRTPVGRGRMVRRGVTPTATAAGGRGPVAPGRRTSAVAKTATPQHPNHHRSTAAPTAAAAAAAGGGAERVSPSPEELPRWSSLTPTTEPTSTAYVKPIAKLAVAAKSRKLKKSAAANAAAADAAAAAAAAAATAAITPPTEPSLSASTTPTPPLPPPERGESVVEYELFTGELVDVDADSSAEDIIAVSPLTLQRQQEHQASRPHNLAAVQTTPPQPRSEHRHAAGFHVSPEASPTVLTSAETSTFMQPFSAAQLAAEMESGETDVVNGEWVTATTTAVVERNCGNMTAVMTRVEVAEARPQSEDNDEGYDADSGMPAAHVGSGLKSPPQRPRSVSATSNDDVILGSAGSASATEMAANRSAPHVNGLGALGTKTSTAGGVSAVDLSSSSSDSETEISTASPVVVG